GRRPGQKLSPTKDRRRRLPDDGVRERCPRPRAAVVARSSQRTETDRRGCKENGGVRRHGAARKAAHLRQGRRSPTRVRILRGESRDSGGRHLHSPHPDRRAARRGARAFREGRARRAGASRLERRRRGPRGPRPRSGVALARARRRAGGPMTTPAASLLAKTKDRSALCGVVGLGYVGLPLVIEFVRAGYKVIGFDVSQKVVDLLNDGRSHIKDVPASVVAEAVRSGKFVATTDLTRLREPDAISICVPTPLSKTKDPDVSY